MQQPAEGKDGGIFSKTIGDIGNLRFRFYARLDAQKEVEGGLRIEGNEWEAPLSFVERLLPQLDNIANLETELKRLDASFK